MNPSGFTPTEYKVLIEPKAVEEKIGSVFIPQMKQDEEKYKQIEGRIIAASPLAFSYASQDEWDAAGAQKPRAGDLVLYAKFAGEFIKGKDGKDYRLVNDKDICAVIEE